LRGRAEAVAAAHEKHTLTRAPGGVGLTTIKIIRTFHEFNRAQWLPAEELHQRSEARLARLLRHAVENVPFYRGLSSDRLPVMDKAAYRSHESEAFTAANLPTHRRLEKVTSGSTGVPFRFAADRASLSVSFASQLSYDSWIGLQPYQRCLCGSPCRRHSVPRACSPGCSASMKGAHRRESRSGTLIHSGPRTSGGALSKSRDPKLLGQLRSRALESLIEMARWQVAGYAYTARILLGRIASIEETEL
jgi:hypothetical protein